MDNIPYINENNCVHDIVSPKYIDNEIINDEDLSNISSEYYIAKPVDNKNILHEYEYYIDKTVDNKNILRKYYIAKPVDNKIINEYTIGEEYYTAKPVNNEIINYNYWCCC